MPTAAWSVPDVGITLRPETPAGAGLLVPRVEFSLVLPEDPGRIESEQFIARRFHEVYGASIVEFSPLLLARRDNGGVSAIVGLRPGTQRPLFLEQYLDSSLEAGISRATGRHVERFSLVEIGNLASRCKSGSQMLFILLTAILHRAGFDWVVFTATEQIRLLLLRLRFEPYTLCEAEASRLVNRNQVWGSYYESRPKVQAGNLAAAMAVLDGNPHANSILLAHAKEIQRLASALKLQCGNREI